MLPAQLVLYLSSILGSTLPHENTLSFLIISRYWYNSGCRLHILDPEDSPWLDILDMASYDEDKRPCQRDEPLPSPHCPSVCKATRDTLHIYTCCTGCEVQIEQDGLTTPHRPSRGGGQPGTLSGQLITVISVLAFSKRWTQIVGCVTEGNPAVFISNICACQPRCRSSRATHSCVPMVLSNTSSFHASEKAGLLAGPASWPSIM